MVFKKGHPPYYTGGSVPGHAPTNTTDLAHLNGPDGAWRKAFNDPTSKTYALRFDQPQGRVNQKKGGGRPKDRERECLEAIQNSEDPQEETDAALESRFPPGLIKRMRALHQVSIDPDHKDFMNSQRLVRDILFRQRGTVDGDGREADTIEVKFGRIDVPMPGQSARGGQEAEESSPPKAPPSE